MSCFRRWSRSAFTLVELLVVVAIIALLISILLPSLARAREQAKKVRCMANLKDLGSASNAYASEDTNNILVPTPRRKACTPGTGFAWFWGNDTFGGKGGNPNLVNGANNWKYVWTAAQAFGPGDRPLNRLLAKDLTAKSYERALADDEQYQPSPTETRLAEHTRLELEQFHCPSDVGLKAGAGVLNAANGFAYAPGNADVLADTPFYDITGNSYATHWATPLWPDPTTGGLPFRGAGAIQRPANRVPNPSRCIIYREANGQQCEDYNSVYGPQNADSQSYRMNGWHGEDMVFNAAFADGHSAPMAHLVRTNVSDISADGQTLTYTEYTLRGARIEPVILPNNTPGGWVNELLYIRGDGWQLDFFPQPMVIVYNDGSDANL